MLGAEGYEGSFQLRPSTAVWILYPMPDGAEDQLKWPGVPGGFILNVRSGRFPRPSLLTLLSVHNVVAEYPPENTD